MQIIQGYSKLTRDQQFEKLIEQGFITPEIVKQLKLYWHKDQAIQNIFDDITENVLSNYYLPFSLIPNVIINNKSFLVPAVIEESSVVAAASSAAKFWATNGGFKTNVKSQTKLGQIHFKWKGSFAQLMEKSEKIKEFLVSNVTYLTENMVKRGGGIIGFEFIDFTNEIQNYYQIRISFNTADAMGANFINTCLEIMADSLKLFISNEFLGQLTNCDILMAILSNYTPECIVECIVDCSYNSLLPITSGLSVENFVEKFEDAVKIAHFDINRAVTHNKGIFNGIDAVVLASGNDFRAVESCAHAYASRNGHYMSLSRCENDGRFFKFIIEVPLALGTVGGLTKVHPLANLGLKILNQPSAGKLMEIAAAIGMANHFSAIRALITNGIQKGHMKMHLSKILQHLNASDEEHIKANEYFKQNTISFKSVENYISDLRNL
jgi:hydroxymethylglutaryl-CoA reductase